jgi:hypothetical protein
MFASSARQARKRGGLSDAAEKLRDRLEGKLSMPETPLEAQAVMESAVEAIGAALRRLDSAAPAKISSAAPPPGGPTRQQGQFLAFSREYMMRNKVGLAPSRADFLRFFDLTPGLGLAEHFFSGPRIGTDSSRRPSPVDKPASPATLWPVWVRPTTNSSSPAQRQPAKRAGRWKVNSCYQSTFINPGWRNESAKSYECILCGENGLFGTSGDPAFQF